MFFHFTMPELPEVETIKNDLAPVLLGRTISGIHVLWPKALKNLSPEAMEQAVVGRKIVGIGRRGKYLLFRLDSGNTLIIHLKMSGSLMLIKSNYGCSDPYIRIILNIGDSYLAFKDVRKFGALWLVSDEREFFRHLGLEPMERQFTYNVLGELLRDRTAPIKAVLLDQSVIAGIGNMYADEALFQARLNPLRKAGKLKEKETQRLHRSIKNVLKKGIELGGASVSTYRRPDGREGLSQVQFKVAHRRGKLCLRCDTPLDYVKIRGRGTTFCPQCQS